MVQGRQGWRWKHSAQWRTAGVEHKADASTEGAARTGRPQYRRPVRLTHLGWVEEPLPSTHVSLKTWDEAPRAPGTDHVDGWGTTAEALRRGGLSRLRRHSAPNATWPRGQRHYVL